MNSLINLIVLWVVLYFTLENIIENNQNPFMRKMYLVVIVLATQMIYRTFLHIAKLNKDKNFNILDKIDESFNRSLLVLLGYMILNDLSGSTNLISRIEGLSVLIKLDWFKVLFITIPYFAYSIIKCLLTPH